VRKEEGTARTITNVIADLSQDSHRREKRSHEAQTICVAGRRPANRDRNRTATLSAEPVDAEVIQHLQASPRHCALFFEPATPPGAALPPESHEPEEL
jgi:hypothetical protein